MMFIAMPIDCDHTLDEVINLGLRLDADVLFSIDQATVADWAAQRAATTKTDYQVFKLTEVLYYRGKR